MKSKVIGLLLLGTIFAGGVQANAATFNSGTTSRRVVHNRPVKPSTNQGSTENNTVVSDKFMAQVEQAIFNKVNEERAKAGVSPLSYNYTI